MSGSTTLDQSQFHYESFLDPIYSKTCIPRSFSANIVQRTFDLNHSSVKTDNLLTTNSSVQSSVDARAQTVEHFKPKNFMKNWLHDPKPIRYTATGHLAVEGRKTSKSKSKMPSLLSLSRSRPLTHSATTPGILHPDSLIRKGKSASASLSQLPEILASPSRSTNPTLKSRQVDRVSSRNAPQYRNSSDSKLPSFGKVLIILGYDKEMIKLFILRQWCTYKSKCIENKVKIMLV